MKKVIVLCVLALGVLGSQPSLRAEEAATQDAPARLKDVPGVYAGQLGAHKIRVWIKKIDSDTLSGMTIWMGKERPFSIPFVVVEKEGTTEVTATEPADYPDDGVFRFRYQLGAPTLTGSWTNGTKTDQTFKFELPRHQFHYDPKVGKFPETSGRLLKKADVENRSQGELWRMRDEIYARHGLSFNIAETQIYFHEQDWYMPVSKDVRAEITDIEKQNLALIERYVHHEKMFARRFGR